MATEQMNMMENIETQFKSIYELLNTHNKQTREIQDTLRGLQKTTKGAVRQVKTNKKKFQEKLNLSNELAKFLSVDSGVKLTKAEVMKSVSDYIKTNNLQLEENKRRFKPNKQMAKIFEMKQSDKLTFVEINKHVSSHLSR